MRFLVHSLIPPADSLGALGQVEYSYGLVLKAFEPMLEKLGAVEFIADPKAADSAGPDTVYLSFSPPHLTHVAEGCRTIPVFAWEFDTIPTDTWFDDPVNDWRTTLARCAGAIVHSELTVTAVKAAMGEDYPVIALPAPVFDRMASGGKAKGGKTRIGLSRGVILDTHDPAIGEVWPGEALISQVLSDRRHHEITGKPPERTGREAAGAVFRRRLAEWKKAVQLGKPVFDAGQPYFADAGPNSSLWRLKSRQTMLSGIVFTSVFNPQDGRKNWGDMLAGFCEAFAEEPNATLVFKLSHTEYKRPLGELLMNMARLPAFKCRVVLIHGVLDEASYEALARASHFAVNASYGEGQCLPLMEFMSAGAPAIAPDGSGMADYVDESVGFVVRTWPDATAWPHDPRLAYRTLRHAVDYGSLVEGYRRAYSLAVNDPEGYAAMSGRAIERMRAHCSRDAVAGRLTAFLGGLGR